MQEITLEKLYRVSEIHKEYGYPLERVREVARRVNRKSKPEAERGFYYSLTASEIKKYLG